MKKLCCIYKIINKTNNQVYIGQTIDFERRKYEHLNRYNLQESKVESSYLYRAMRKYGIENFEFLILEETEKEKLNDLEKHYIKEYNSFYNGYNMTEGGQNDSPNAKLSKEDVVLIRKLYDSQTNFSNHEIWENNFKDKISFSYFRNLWSGMHWKEIMPEVFTEENKNYYLSKNKGSKHGVFTDDEVFLIRKEYNYFTAKELYKKYGEDKISFRGFEAVLRSQNYKHIPHYKELKGEKYE